MYQAIVPSLELQSHPPVTGVLKWEILESALESAPDSEGAPGNRRVLGGAPESAQGNWGCSRSAPESAQCGASTERALSGAPPRAPRFPGAPSGALPRALSRISHFRTPVTGGWDCKS